MSRREPSDGAARPSPSLPRRVANALGRLLADPVSLTLACALAVIVVAKLSWWAGAGPGRPAPLRLVAADGLLLGSVAGGLNLVRAKLHRGVAGIVTSAVSLAIVVPIYALALFEALSLWGTGVPLHREGLALAVERWGDLVAAGSAELGTTVVAAWPIVLAAPLVVAGLASWRRRRGGAASRPILVPPLLIMLLGLAGLAFPAGGGAAADRVENVHVRLLVQALERRRGVTLAQAPYAPTAEHLASLADSGRPPPDIFVIVLESVGFDVTSFNSQGPRLTPFLVELARHGRAFTNLQTTIPHTSKSLVGVLCGTYPSPNRELVEAGTNYPLRCLPHYLGQVGYRSLFIQSADGTFEQRPRLVAKMGFDTFLARQNLGPTAGAVGYLAGDDGAMIGPLLEWLEAEPAPAFVTVLTSVSHHPYLMPPTQPGSAAVNTRDPRARYRTLVEWTDAWLADLIRRLGAAGALDDALVVVLGDHGESFRAEEGLGHSNVYGEEALRVAAVLWGHDVSPGPLDTRRRSTIDIAPTLLELAGVTPSRPLPGVALTSQPASDRVVLSASWFTDYWIAASSAHRKAVIFPGSGEVVPFDLDAPGLRLPAAPDTPEWLVAAARQWARESLTDVASATLPEHRFYGDLWGCDAEVCWWVPTGVGVTFDEAITDPQRLEVDPVFEHHRAVAHALGGVDETAYTNSRAAFERSVELGFRLLEVDLYQAPDGQLYCFHEGDEDRLRWTGPAGDWATGRPRLDGRYPVMSADELIELLISHPDTYLITDTKGDVVAVLEQLVAAARRRDPDLVRRIIPQLYRPEDIDRVDAVADFERRMLTLYRMPDVSDEAITALAERHRIGAVVMPPGRARPDFVAALREVGALVYVHTLNRPGNIEAALAQGVHGIYTDFDHSLLVDE